MRTVDMREIAQVSAEKRKKKSKKTEETSIDLLPLVAYRPVAILAFVLFCILWWGTYALMQAPSRPITQVEKPSFKRTTYFNSGKRNSL